MSKPTIAEIRERCMEKESHFFSRDTLKFFGQRMADFSVRVSPKGNVYILAPAYDIDRVTGSRRFMHYTFRLFTGDDLKMVRGDDDNLLDTQSKESIDRYIRGH